MKNKYEHFQDFLEWEIIDEDIQITNLSFKKEKELFGAGNVVSLD